MHSKILLIDDIQDNLDLLEDLLYDEFNDKVQFLQALSGKLALNIVKKYDINLILLDIMMPDMDGFEVCKQLKQNDNTKNIPIIFISAKNSSEDIVKGFKLGISDYIPKPFCEEELIARVKTHLNLNITTKRLENSRLELIQANRLKSEFMANISHELRTPLNSVIGFSSLLLKNKNNNLDTKQINYLNAINRNGLNLLEMVSEVIELSKIEIGKIELNIKSIDLISLINKLIKLLQKQANEKAIQLQFTNKINKDSLIYNIDEQKLNQVLIHLINNALKFTAGSSGLIEVILTQDDRYFIITVKDNGIGIDTRNFNEIFKDFTKIEDTNDKTDASLGLGLSISKRIIEYMGGFINLQSVKGEGSKFSIYLKR